MTLTISCNTLTGPDLRHVNEQKAKNGDTSAHDKQNERTQRIHQHDPLVQCLHHQQMSQPWVHKHDHAEHDNVHASDFRNDAIPRVGQELGEGDTEGHDGETGAYRCQKRSFHR